MIASFSQTSATGLSNLVNGEISHNQVNRFLSQEKKTAKDLWLIAKSFVKQIQSEHGVCCCRCFEERNMQTRFRRFRLKLEIGEGIVVSSTQ